MPKAAATRATAGARRHNPLAEDIVTAGHIRAQPGKKNKRVSQTGEDNEDGERFIDAKTSRKILQIGQELADEDAAERKSVAGPMPTNEHSAFDFGSRPEDEELLSDDEANMEEQWGDEEEEVEEVVWTRLFSYETLHADLLNRKSIRMISIYSINLFRETMKTRYLIPRGQKPVARARTWRISSWKRSQSMKRSNLVLGRAGHSSKVVERLKMPFKFQLRL